MSVCSAFAQKVLGEAWRLRRLMCGGRCLAVQTNLNAAASPAGSRLCSKVFGDQRSNEGRSPNEEKTFSARQSRASHRGGEAAENRLFVRSWRKLQFRFVVVRVIRQPFGLTAQNDPRNNTNNTKQYNSVLTANSIEPIEP